MSEMFAVTKDTRIGWIGTGVMGRAMCGHVLRQGRGVTVYNRTPEKAASLIQAGAKWAQDPLDVARQSDVIFTIVGYPHDVREVVLGDRGALHGCDAGNVIVDMTTSEPSLAVEIAEAAQVRQVHAIDAPVSGGDVGAREARLSMMIGGEAEIVCGLMPLFETMGKTIVHQGGPGAGQHTKMVNQTLIATGIIGVCEALLYAHRAGLDLERVMQSVASGAAGSWSLTNYGPRILRGDFDPGFFVDHFVKDLGIALSESKRMGLVLPGLQLAEQLFLELQSQGHGRAGIQALQVSLAAMSDIKWTARH